jgi:nucleoid-associated protein YgaU
LVSSSAFGGLVKAQILVHDKNGKIPTLSKDGQEGKDQIKALFNPSQYSIDKTNTFASMQVPGRESSIIQFVRGESETLSLELFFDTYTYESSKDVREYTNKIRDLLNIDPEIHAPRICSFVWGKGGFTGVIEKAIITYTMFLSNGTPVRAKVNLTFRQYQKTEQEEARLSSPDKTKRITITDGDSLWLIAAEEYGDPAKWRAIADANNIDNPLALEPGTEIIIPKIEI